MNYHTLSDFRTQHSEWLKEQVVTNIAAMRAEGLASLDVLGQDGMRVRATRERTERLKQTQQEVQKVAAKGGKSTSSEPDVNGPAPRAGTADSTNSWSGGWRK